MGERRPCPRSTARRRRATTRRARAAARRRGRPPPQPPPLLRRRRPPPLPRLLPLGRRRSLLGLRTLGSSKAAARARSRTPTRGPCGTAPRATAGRPFPKRPRGAGGTTPRPPSLPSLLLPLLASLALSAAAEKAPWPMNAAAAAALGKRMWSACVKSIAGARGGEEEEEEEEEGGGEIAAAVPPPPAASSSSSPSLAAAVVAVAVSPANAQSVPGARYCADQSSSSTALASSSGSICFFCGE